MNYLKNYLKPVGIVLIDPTTHRFSIEASIALLLSLITQLRFDIPVIPVINKSDLGIGPKSNSLIMELSEVRESLRGGDEGLISDLLSELLNVIDSYLPSVRLVRVSAKTGEGLDKLYKLVHEVFCVCGDLT